ncbi:hypothetical protein PO878_09380 [Iamia majanohamensis]|uniref:Restriction endonuclease n=1 Tax=Iamia majanohamensis TaxID=467976 RepID=A0AAF0BXM7_9ACTN|nr:hypothetical protein [Iamia majanohamensis]WCO68934.1 hypothetical protein PO878_09380 [Iamia majanohamensis]
MSARDDLVAAAERLVASGRSTFSPAQLIAEVRRAGSDHPDTTLRSVLVGYLSRDEGEPSPTPDVPFVRSGRGQYRLSVGGVPEGDDPPVGQGPATTAGDPTEEWMWEGNVQAAVVRALAADGWDIARVADTKSREQGHDIVARQDGVDVLVEVKGYPSTRYVRGDKAGQQKTYAPQTQARAYFSHALLSGTLMRAENPSSRVVLAFPAVATYENLARRLSATLHRIGIEVWLVDEAGTVEAAPS